MSISALIFDFGNVLATWSPHNLYRRFFPNNLQAIDAFLKEIDFHHWNAQQDCGRSFAEGVADLSQSFPQYAHLIRAYDEEWDKAIVGEIAGTITLVEQLKLAGYPLYILTNFSAEKFPRMRQRFGFLDHFDEIFVSGEIGLVKPDPGIFMYLLSKINYAASECLFVDDALANIAQAENLGFITHHFTAPEKLKAHLEQFGVL